MLNIKSRIYYKALKYVQNYDLKKLLKKESVNFNSSYEMAETAKIISFYFSEIDVLIDIGAHKGKFSNAFAAFVKTGRFICIEPNEVLHDDIRKNNKESKVEIFALGLAERDGKSEYFVHQDSTMNSIVESDKKILAEKFPYDNPDLLTKKEIDITTMDKFMEKYQTAYLPDENIFLKIDTQGNELNILRGAVNTLKNVKGCLVEQMFVNAYKSDYNFYDLLLFMMQNGFELAGTASISKRQSYELSSADFLFIRKSN
ncbi:N/A [soil metagenome]